MAVAALDLCTGLESTSVQLTSLLVQRLLAHRVAQHHGLQTSVLSNGSGPDSECRVIAIKTPETAMNTVCTPSCQLTDHRDKPQASVLTLS